MSIRSKTKQASLEKMEGKGSSGAGVAVETSEGFQKEVTARLQDQQGVHSSIHHSISHSFIHSSIIPQVSIIYHPLIIYPSLNHPCNPPPSIHQPIHPPILPYPSPLTSSIHQFNHPSLKFPSSIIHPSIHPSIIHPCLHPYLNPIIHPFKHHSSIHPSSSQSPIHLSIAQSLGDSRDPPQTPGRTLKSWTVGGIWIIIRSDGSRDLSVRRRLHRCTTTCCGSKL